MNLTRENLKNKKIEIIEDKLSKEELDKIKQKIKEEVDNIILNFNGNDNEVMIDE